MEGATSQIGSREALFLISFNQECEKWGCVSKVDREKAEKLVNAWESGSKHIPYFSLSEKVVRESFRRFRWDEECERNQNAIRWGGLECQNAGLINDKMRAGLGVIAQSLREQMDNTPEILKIKCAEISRKLKEAEGSAGLVEIVRGRIEQRISDIEGRFECLYHVMIYRLQLENVPELISRGDQYGAVGLELEGVGLRLQHQSSPVLEEFRVVKGIEQEWLKKIEVVKRVEVGVKKELEGEEKFNFREVAKKFCEALRTDSISLYSSLESVFEKESELDTDKILGVLQELENSDVEADEALYRKFFVELGRCFKKRGVEESRTEVIEKYTHFLIQILHRHAQGLFCEATRAAGQTILDHFTGFDPLKKKVIPMMEQLGGKISLEQMFKRRLNKDWAQKIEKKIKEARWVLEPEKGESIGWIKGSRCIRGLKNEGAKSVLSISPKTLEEMYSLCNLVQNLCDFSLSIDLSQIEQIGIKDFLKIPEKTRKRIVEIDFSCIRAEGREEAVLKGIAKVLHGIEALRLPHLEVGQESRQILTGLEQLQYVELSSRNLGQLIGLEAPKLSTIKIDRCLNENKNDLEMLGKVLRSMHQVKHEVPRINFILNPFDEATKEWAKKQIESQKRAGELQISFSQPMEEQCE